MSRWILLLIPLLLAPIDGRTQTVQPQATAPGAQPPGRPAGTAAVRPLPADAVEPLREAARLLETIRTSGLEGWLRANAGARLARAYARAGDVETATTLVTDALTAAEEPSRTPAPPALSLAAVLAIATQASVDMRDNGARDLAARAWEEVGKLSDSAIKAGIYAYLAGAYADMGEKDAAARSCVEALRAVSTATQPRDRIAALGLVASVQQRIGDTASATETIQLARALLPSLTDPLSRAAGLAHLARAESALGLKERGRPLSREAATTYDKGVADPMPFFQRVSLLTLIALSQTESGDRQAARSTMTAARQTATRVDNPYERFTAMTALADAVLQIERAP